MRHKHAPISGKMAEEGGPKGEKHRTKGTLYPVQAPEHLHPPHEKKKVDSEHHQIRIPPKQIEEDGADTVRTTAC